jgi:hypothetical protein
MEVAKVPQADPAASRAGTAGGPATGSAAGTAQAAQTATPADTESSSAAAVISAADFADIRPLDLAAALQILVAEVRAGLDAYLEGSIGPNAAAQGPATANAAPNSIAQNPIAQSPIQAAHDLVDMFLRALPEDASDAPAWTAVLTQLETAVLSSVERAVSVVAAWRDIPPPVVDAVKQTRAMIFEALGDELQNPSWLRPEWMGLATPLQRFRRRRRNARRRLTDPDYPLVNLDESEDFRR